MIVKGLMNNPAKFHLDPSTNGYRINLKPVENALITPPDGRNWTRFSGALFCFVIYLSIVNEAL